MNLRFSVIIPARNEEHNLPKSIGSIKSSLEKTNKRYEIIVVNNRSTDRTREVAESLGAKVVESDAKNLSIIRNTGAKAANGEIIVTVDADNFISKNMFEEIDKRLSNPKIIGGGVMMYPERYSLGIISTAILLLFPMAVILRISCGLFYLRKVDFDALNGFNENKVTAEDVDFAFRLKKLGKRKKQKFSTIFNEYLITSCRKFDKFGDWYFFQRPWNMIKMALGTSQEIGDKYWYDFEEKGEHR